MVSSFNQIFRGKKVLVTGHTGFKGSWLILWLEQLGAEVYGYALAAEEESFYRSGDLDGVVNDQKIDDIDNYGELKGFVRSVSPDFVFHLAAQPLVRYSYDAPIETIRTNVLGTAHVLDCFKDVTKKTVIICVTTDKCYSNKEWLYSYRENDAMGGYDPYSASKGAAELIIDSYLNSYFGGESQVKIAAVRAGNVIGGGDWAIDRIIPDCVRAIKAGEDIPVRNKIATRPWQHVLEPLSGYLQLAQTLYEEKDLRANVYDYMKGFNFGPELRSNRTVEELVCELLKHLEGSWVDASDPNAVHEASKLNLSIDKAFHLLSWWPVWDFETTIKKTAQWYKNAIIDDKQFSISQISEYTQDASKAGLSWA